MSCKATRCCPKSSRIARANSAGNFLVPVWLSLFTWLLLARDPTLQGVLLLAAKVGQPTGGTWPKATLLATLWRDTEADWLTLAGKPQRVSRGQSRNKPPLQEVRSRVNRDNQTGTRKFTAEVAPAILVDSGQNLVDLQLQRIQNYPKHF